MVMDKIDQARTALYIRNLQNTSDSPLLFLLSGGRPISKLSSRLKSVGLRYNLDLPNASRVRKIGATSVALNLDDKEARLVTRQMSHSVATNAAYYQAIVGEQHAADAYRSMAELREGKGTQLSHTPKTPQDSPSPSPRRRLFTESETALVRTYFEQHLQRRSTPTIRECGMFLTLLCVLSHLYTMYRVNC